MKNLNRYTFLILLLSVFCVTACGFHLRGYRPLPTELKTLYIDSSQPYSTISVQLQQVLHSMGVNIVKNKELAPFTLKLFDENFSSSILSNSASAATREYTLSFSLKYSLLDSTGQKIYGPQKLTTTRNLLVSEDEVLSSRNEQAVLKQDMQRDLMYQIINQLSAKDVILAVTGAS